MPIRLGAAVFCGLVLALTGCSAAPGSPAARPSPAVSAPATLPPATPPSAPPPSTNPPMGPVVPTGRVGPPTDAPGAPFIEQYELSRALALEEAAGRQTWHRLECGMQTQCLEAPERACDRWYGQLSRHAQKGQTWTLDGPSVNAEAIVYPTPEGREVTATLVAGAPAVLDWLGTDPLARCEGFQIAPGYGDYKPLMAYAARLSGGRPLGPHSSGYVVWEVGGAAVAANPPQVAKEVRFGPYLLQIRFPLAAGRRGEAEAVKDLDAITDRAYARARAHLVG